MNAGKQFRLLRESKNITRQQLAEKANVCLSTIVKWELDEVKPTAFTIYKVAKVLDVDELELIKIFRN